MKRIFSILSLLVFLLISHISISQEKHNLEIASKYPKENRKFTVHLPKSYNLEEYKRYPVMYVLDGQVAETFVPAVTKIFSDRDRAPEIIIVTLPSFGNRNRDYTPRGKNDDGITTGAANQFFNFLAKELIPFIDKKYRTDPFRIISGESRGGLFALHSFIKNPELFQSYFIFSPALYHNNEEIIPRLKTFLASKPTFKSSLYMNIGAEGGIFKEAFSKAWEIFKKYPLKNLQLKIETLPYDYHGLTGISGHHNAYLTLYPNWRTPFEVVQSKGAEGIITHFKKLSQLYNYNVLPPEDQINSYAYTFLNRKNYEVMLSLFELNVNLYPASANAYDSLADGYETVGKLAEAKKAMHKALEIAKPNNPAYQNYVAHSQKLENKINNK